MQYELPETNLDEFRMKMGIIGLSEKRPKRINTQVELKTPKDRRNSKALASKQINQELCSSCDESSSESDRSSLGWMSKTSNFKSCLKEEPEIFS